MVEVPANCVGRIVWGNPAKASVKKDQRTKQPILKDGKPIEQWAFGVAFSKADFNQFIWPFMSQEIQQIYPNGTPQNFSFKYKDGDTVDRNGKPYSLREGYAGNIVLNVSTEAFAPPIYKRGANGQFAQLDPSQIKTGDYVALALNIKGNKPTDISHTPGVYVNPVAIEHIGYGTEIFNGPDAETLFGGRQLQLPPGASAQPVMGGGAAMPGTQMQPGPAPMQQPGQMPPPAPVQQYQQPPMQQPYQPGPAPMQQPAPQYQQPPMQQPQQMPPPAHDFTQNAGMQQQPYQPGPAPMQQPYQPGPAPMQQPGMMPGR